MAKRKSSKTRASERKRKLLKETSSKEEAKRKAESSRMTILQINLGRTAQMYGIYAALTLALNAFIATVGGSDLAFADLPIFKEDYFLWLISLTVGLILSAAVVIQKANYYAGQMKAGHYFLSILSVIISVLIPILIFLHATNIFVMGYVAWIYPMSVLGLSLAMISLAATWERGSKRRTASIICAALPPIFFLFTLFPGYGTPDKIHLVLVYLFGALAIELSGSLLLIIATATKAHEREIVKAGDAHLTYLRDEYEQRLQAIDYKEKAVRAQEAHIETREIELRSLEDEIAEKKRATEQLMLRIETQFKDLKNVQRQVSNMKADLQAKTEEWKLRDKKLKDWEKDIQRLEGETKNREARLLEHEKELKRRDIDIAESLRKSEERLAVADETEKSIKSEMEDLERRRNEVIQSEKDLELRESDIQLKIEKLEAIQAENQEEKVKELKDWEEKVLKKEKELGKLEVDLRKIENEMKVKAEEVARADARLQQQRLQLTDKEKDLVAREKQLSDLETNISQKSKQIEQQIEGLKSADERFGEKETEYEKLFRSLKEQEAALLREQESLKGQMEELEIERQKARNISENLSREVRILNEKHRKVSAKEKEIEQRDGDLRLRLMAIDKREKAIAGTPIPEAADEEREKVMELRERRLREREDEFRRRMYQKEKEMEALETALKEKERILVVAAGGEEAAAAETVQAADEKIKTGISRFDDLLFGGMKMNSNIALIGPAFIGKEILALNFLAEGLRKGIPGIIVTTTKPPVEIAKDMAPVLPAFMEYEQHGLVWWIDASRSLPEKTKAKKEGTVYHVNGPTDFENIMDIIDNLDSEFRAKNLDYFRLIYLSLSSSTTQTDERMAVGFVQKLVNRLRETKAVSIMTLERGMHTDQQLQTLEHLMDGAIVFKTEKSKNLLSVMGIGEVQTREWVPYRFTNKSLIIGAFQLERIK